MEVMSPTLQRALESDIAVIMQAVIQEHLDNENWYEAHQARKRDGADDAIF